MDGQWFDRWVEVFRHRIVLGYAGYGLCMFKDDPSRVNPCSIGEGLWVLELLVHDADGMSSGNGVRIDSNDELDDKKYITERGKSKIQYGASKSEIRIRKG